MLKSIQTVFLTVVFFLFSVSAFAKGRVLLDGKEIKTKDQLHGIVAQQLNFPRYYTKTLDGMYDILSTDFSGESVIKIKHLSILKARIGSEYIDAMVQAIQDAADDNSKLILVVE